MSATSITSEVADRFHSLRRIYLLSQCAIGLLTSIAGWLLGWALLAAVDYQFELSLDIRRIVLTGLTSVVVLWFVFRSAAIVRRAQTNLFASHLEYTFGDFGQRIRTVLDTVAGRVNGPDEMLSALGHQTMGRWETLGPEQIVPRRLLMFSVGATAILACVCAALMVQSEDWSIAMNRAVGGTKVYTQLTVTPGNKRLLEGAIADVSMTLTGRTDRQVSIRYREIFPASAEGGDTQNGDWMESNLSQQVESESDDQASDFEHKAVFAVSLGKAEHPMEYQFLTDVADSPIYRIDVQPLIEADEVATQVNPPAYTGLNERRFTTRQVTVPEGSDVTVQVQTNHPLHKVVLEVGRRSNTLKPVTVTAGNDATVWQFPLSSDQISHWKFSGYGVDGSPMTPVKGRVSIRRDARPKISFIEPTDRLEVHTLAEVPLTVNVSDDYGLQECGLVFELGDEGQFVLTDWNAETAPQIHGTTTKVKLNDVLPLESLELTERDFISYYAYAIDNKESGPQRFTSDFRYIDIRKLRQYFRERDLPATPGNGGQGNRLRATLGDIIQRERFLVNRTRRLTRSAEVDLTSQLGTIERMVENQSNLAGLVRQLTTFLLERGNDDVSALNQAESFMLQASDSLAAASFDLALNQQNDSLLALAEARRTVEIILNKSNTRRSGQATARFFQQMRQKLRRKRPKTDRELVDNLERIANDQQRLSVMTGSAMRKLDTEPTKKPNDALVNDDTTANFQADEVAPEFSDSTPPNQEALPVDEEIGETEKAKVAGKSVREESGAPVVNQPPLPQEQLEKLFAQQVEILQRFQAISDELTPREDLSDLVRQRLELSLENLDLLASNARDLTKENVVQDGIDAADSLRELSLHMKALIPRQAVERVGMIRDLTRELSGFEYATSTKLSAADDLAKNDNQVAWNPLKLGMKQVASRTAARTNTIVDVLQIPVEMGDVETSEVNDELRKVIEETEFDQRLQDALEVAEEAIQSSVKSVTAERSAAALKRATEFAEVAERLDELYRELVAPKIKRLRQLESQACKLQGGGGGGGGRGAKPQQPQTKTDKKEGAQQLEAEQQATEAERKTGMQQLKLDLEAAGLNDLAELLDPEQTTPQQLLQMMKNAPKSSNKDTTLGSNSLPDGRSIRIDLLVKKLHDRIQQVILLEISADRNASVPAEYETLVDGYFRALAEGQLNQ